MHPPEGLCLKAAVPASWVYPHRAYFNKACLATAVAYLRQWMLCMRVYMGEASMVVLSAFLMSTPWCTLWA